MNNEEYKASEQAVNNDEESLKNEAQDVEAMDDLPDEEGQEIEEEKEIINDELNQINALNQQLEQSKADLEKEKKEYLYLMAEFDNFRKRTVRERADLVKSASEGVLKDLLPVVDDFERAIEANKNSDDIEAIKAGAELIYNKVIKLLEKNGVKPIESTGLDFNADLHEAIAAVPVTDESQKGKVIDTLTKGYTLNDKVIRHAKVAVGQ